MKQTNRQTNEAEIRIYQSLWKNMLLGILCLAFAVGGYSIIKDEECNLVTKVLGGWLNVIFFGGRRIVRHHPYAIQQDSQHSASDNTRRQTGNVRTMQGGLSYRQFR